MPYLSCHFQSNGLFKNTLNHHNLSFQRETTNIIPLGTKRLQQILVKKPLMTRSLTSSEPTPSYRGWEALVKQIPLV